MSRTQEDLSLNIKPVTINIDPDLHIAMKALAKKRRVHISYLYAEALEDFLNKQAPKKQQRIS